MSHSLKLFLSYEYFYILSDVRKTDGTEYDPESFKVMIASIDRYLKSKAYPYSITTHRLFETSKSALEGKCRRLRAAGAGKRKNRAESLTTAEENVLWECGQLGADNGQSLKQTIWWVLTQHLGLRGRELHHDLRVEELVHGVDNANRPFYKYVEPPTKSRARGLHHKHRIVEAKLYPSGGPRCPYALFELYKSKRPEALRESGYMYMYALDKPEGNVWYSEKRRDGVNAIGKFMQNMIANSPLNEMCPNKKLTAHSGRKTAVRKLKASNFSRDQIRQVTGHAGVAGLDPYDSGNEDEMAAMSAALAQNASAPSTSAPKSFAFGVPWSSPTALAKDPSAPTTSAPRSFSFCIPWSSAEVRSAPSIQANHVYIINNSSDIRIGAENKQMIISSQESREE